MKIINNWRLIAAIILFIGFPVWFVYWINYPNVLVYLYAVMGYLVLDAYLMASWVFKKCLH